MFFFGELVYEIYRLIYVYNTSRIHSAVKMPPQAYALQYQTSQFLLEKVSDERGT